MRLADYDLSSRYPATVISSSPLTASDADAEVRELELDVEDPAFAPRGGSSIAVIVPGPHEFGQKHHVRLYTVADAPRRLADGHLRFPIAVRRCTAIDRYSGEEHPGIASNYLCDRSAGDIIEIAGPYGLAFPPPAEPCAHLVLIGMGTGIAPFRALVRHLHDDPEWQGHITLFHGACSGLELLYRNQIRDDFAKYYDRPTFEAIAALSPRPHWSDAIAWDHAIGARGEEIWRWLAEPDTYVYVAGLERIRDELDQVFTRIAGSEAAWRRRKAELVAGGRWVELLY